MQVWANRFMTGRGEIGQLQLEGVGGQGSAMCHVISALTRPTSRGKTSLTDPPEIFNWPAADHKYSRSSQNPSIDEWFAHQ